ncbi:uncharacterized protein [Littorina saxatilis]|uniref:uncharacterized protein n=1 Tax=Littorina saxatilis TaxID=31220 RepID=UPI0038B43200
MTARSALPVSPHRTLCLTALVMTMLMTSSVARPQLPSSSPESSHLMFYLTVEKQLIPQTEGLTKMALQLLETYCKAQYDGISQCFSKAEQLPVIPALDDFPSKEALEKEGSKVFTKKLLKDSYNSLNRLEKLLRIEDEGSAMFARLLAQMSKTRDQIKEELVSHYKVQRLPENPKRLNKAKKFYTRQSRSPQQTEKDYRTRLLYTAYTRLMRVSHVLGYTVRLSWIAVGDNTWS